MCGKGQRPAPRPRGRRSQLVEWASHLGVMVVAYGAARGRRFSAGVLASMVTVIAFNSSHELEAGSFLIHPSPFINLVDRRLLSLLSSYHHLPIDVLRPHCGTTTTTLLTDCYDPPHLLSDLTTPRSLHVYALLQRNDLLRPRLRLDSAHRPNAFSSSLLFSS